MDQGQKYHSLSPILIPIATVPMSAIFLKIPAICYAYATDFLASMKSYPDTNFVSIGGRYGY